MYDTEKKILKAIPSRVSDTQVIKIIRTKKIRKDSVYLFKSYTNSKDEVLSNWLNLSVKTLRNYKLKDQSPLKIKTQEHLILLFSLFKHGEEIFGSTHSFNEWLDKENFFLDNDKPLNYLRTISGIRLIEDRITGIEYGDNI